MFRLVKVINGNNQYETVQLKLNSSATFGKGCALTSNSGNASTPSATASPEYISITGIKESVNGKIQAMVVTEDMVFKVELTGTSTPYIGMLVGLSTHKDKMDAVSYNSNGKGVVLAIEDNKKFVYVRFRK